MYLVDTKPLSVLIRTLIVLDAEGKLRWRCRKILYQSQDGIYMDTHIEPCGFHLGVSLGLPWGLSPCHNFGALLGA